MATCASRAVEVVAHRVQRGWRAGHDVGDARRGRCVTDCAVAAIRAHAARTSSASFAATQPHPPVLQRRAKSSVSVAPPGMSSVGAPSTRPMPTSRARRLSRMLRWIWLPMSARTSCCGEERACQPTASASSTHPARALEVARLQHALAGGLAVETNVLEVVAATIMSVLWASAALDSGGDSRTARSPRRARSSLSSQRIASLDCVSVSAFVAAAARPHPACAAAPVVPTQHPISTTTAVAA